MITFLGLVNTFDVWGGVGGWVITFLGLVHKFDARGGCG